MLEYTDNYSMTSVSFWNCYTNEANDDANENNAWGNYRMKNKTKTSKYFEYKTKIMGGSSNNSVEKQQQQLMQYFKSTMPNFMSL